MTTRAAVSQTYADFKAAFPPSRNAKLTAEAKIAFAKMSQADMRAWSSATAAVFAKGVWRRLATLAGSLKNLGTAGQKGIAQLVKQTQQGRLLEYLKGQSKEVAANSRKQIESGKKTLETFAAALRENPREVGPQFLVAVFGYLLASGGLDADGGAPDLDLELGGIGLHRSLFFHSFLVGALLETVIFGLAHAMELAHEQLPDNRDPLWDLIAKHRAQWAEAAANGVSVGVAYHLLVDAFIQTGTYHGIGVAVPSAVHSAGFAANGVVEGLDVGRKKENFRPAGKPR